MYTEIKNFEEFESLKSEPALLAYFSTEACNVCKVLKPKVVQLLEAEFPEMKMAYVKSDVLPDIAGQNRIFTAPTILVFFDGREYIRKSRNIGIGELQEAISRPYNMMFGE
ncbi:thioredoxin family protein [Maribellus mangrovi]|uniref:thioredoxin family protein n=1 Tax=Maribellus mangrovi TaxID=3133146 RepID=UPI0030EEEF4B